MSSDRKPVTVDEMLAWAQTKGFQGTGNLVGFFPEQAEALLTEIVNLRSRIESLERAHGLKPGTSMHAGWKEGSE